MDSSEPSTNGTSASNLYRLSSSLGDEAYAKRGKETVAGFESEMLQYPWLFASFMPSIVAAHLGVRAVVLSGRNDTESQNIAKELRGGLSTIVRVDDASTWLQERNPLLRAFAHDGRTRTLICENGVCRELVPASHPPAQQPLDLSAVSAALPAQQSAGGSGTSGAADDSAPAAGGAKPL